MKALLLLAALAACGHSSQAAMPDAADAADAAGSGPITVVVGYDVQNTSAIAHAGATVLFYGAAGTLLDRQVTDNAGKAIGTGTAGGTVTAVPPAGVTGSIFTWVDVAPGDHLYTTYAVDPGLPQTQPESVTLPRDGDANVYLVSSAGLEGVDQQPPATGNVTITSAVDVHAPPTADLVAEADHSAGHARFIVVPGAALGSDALDLSSSTWSDATPLDVVIDHLDTDVAWIAVVYQTLDVNRALWQSHTYNQTPGATLALHLDSPGSLGDGTAVSLTYQRGPQSAAQFWDASFNGPPPTIDLAAVSPPDATNVAVPGGAQATWQANGDPTRATAVCVNLYTGAGGMTWTAILPGDRRAFAAPPLPGDLPAFAATSAKVMFYGGNEPGGYAAIRTDPQVFDPQQYARVLPATPGMFRIAGQ